MIDCGCDEILLPQGSNGVDGKNAFTVTTASFTQPVVGNPVTITVSDSLQNSNQWAIVDQVIRVTDASGNGGWYQVTGITGTTQITATLLDYPGTTPNGITIQSGAGVSPAGLRGPQGEAGTPGSTGPAGSPNSLSIPIGGVSTLEAGQPATATISGDAPNQELRLGIPRGLPGTNGTSGSTLLTSYEIPFATYTSAPSGQTHNLIPVQGFDPSVLCPTDGSAGRIKINLQCARSSAGFTDKLNDFFALTFYIQQSPSPIIELKPSQNQSAFNDKYQKQFMTGILCDTTVIGSTTFSSITTVSIEITINRITQLSFLYTVDYIWSNGDSFSNVFSGFINSGFSFGLTTASYNFNLINYSDNGKDLTVRGYLTMEKITP